jgi:nitrogen-specific signal transduction histidine kinase
MKFDEDFTEFLSAKRVPMDKIARSYQSFDKQEFIKAVFDGASGAVMILNDHRQAVYVNQKIFETIPGKKLNDVLGYRPGEIFNCVNAISSPGGCGTSKACRVCGASAAIIESMMHAVKSEKECRITTAEVEKMGSMELMVSAVPIVVDQENYYIFTVSDVSNEKRRRVLEQVFFHDVVNIAGGLKNIIKLMKNPKEVDSNINLLEMADVSASSLLDEIVAQRGLLSAENGELRPQFEEAQTSEVLLDVFNILAKNDSALNKKIVIDKKSENFSFFTDKMLIRRIVLNMAKNAVEASGEFDVVTLNCRKIRFDIEFSVHNNGYIPDDVQMQIFQRSFSTKGVNRGIGTYSIKLFTERYLRGRAWFTTDKLNGTTFYVKYPIYQK